jgi:hypothetical protein
MPNFFRHQDASKSPSPQLGEEHLDCAREPKYNPFNVGFSTFTNSEETLKKRVNEALAEIEKKSISELLPRKYVHGLTLFCCPFCPNRFETLPNLLNHIKQRRWEFTKLTRNIHYSPKYFEYHDLFDKEYFDKGKMYWKLRRWVLCCKLMEELNPYGLHPLTTNIEKRKSALYTMALLWLREKK